MTIPQRQALCKGGQATSAASRGGADQLVCQLTSGEGVHSRGSLTL
jgi:hypothetical protein